MEQKPVRLLKRTSLFEADLVCGILQQEGIPYYKKEMGAGTLYCGGSIAGADIYVPESELDRADEIVKSILNAEPIMDEE